MNIHVCINGTYKMFFFFFAMSTTDVYHFELVFVYNNETFTFQYPFADGEC